MRKTSILIFLAMILSLVAGCGRSDLNPSDPGYNRYHSTVSVWYVDDCSKCWDHLEDLIKEYNTENGKANAVKVRASAYSSDRDLVDALLTEEQVPSIVICSGDTAAYLHSIGVSTATDQCFQDWQISRFDSSYLNAGVIDNVLVSVPVAASPDILILNNSLVQNCPSYYQESVTSLESLCQMASTYLQETDQPFLTSESYTTMIRTGMAQLGDTFHADRAVDIQSNNFKYVYNVLAQVAFNRGLSASEEDVTELVMDGKIACGVVSAQSFMKHVDESKLSNISIFPYPTVQNGQSLYHLHFNSALVTASDETEQSAAADFLSWLAAHSDRLTENTGYFPVMAVSEGETHASRISGDSAAYRAIANAFADQERNGSAYNSKNAAEYYENSAAFEADLRNRLKHLNDS